jgi:hypothetical protein
MHAYNTRTAFVAAEENVELSRKALASAMKEWSNSHSRPVMEVQYVCMYNMYACMYNMYV